MKNICIIGFGYIGSKLVEYFSENNKIVCVTKTKNDIQKEFPNVEFIIGHYENLDKSFYNIFDIIILTAGQSSPKSCNNLVKTVYNDLLAFSYITEILDDSQKLIYMSSGIVNDKSSKNYYTIIKNTINDLINVINNTTNKKIYGLCLGTVNGSAPIIRTDLMLNKMVYDAINYKKIQLYNPHDNRPILYINDLCNVIDIIISNGNENNKGIYDIFSFNSTVQILAYNVKNILPNTEIIYSEKNENNYQYNFSMNSMKFIETFKTNFNNIPNVVYKIILDLLNVFKSNVKTKTIENFKPNYELINNCIVCNNQTNILLNLNSQPLANNYHTQNEILDKYPLQLDYCNECFHVQLNCIVNPEILFKNYIYTSGTSNTGKKYFEEFAKKCVNEKNQLQVLDIACNDGSQLDAFKLIYPNTITVGVDPAENLSVISKLKGHDIFCDFFNESCHNLIIEKYGKNSFDIIIAQNVFAHINYPNEFLKMCSELLSIDGKLYIQTSQANMILNNEFDTAYHEHISFFNTNSMKILCYNQNLVLYNTSKVDIHGTSYLFEIHKQNNYEYGNTITTLYEEIDKELYNINTYIEYPLKCNIYKNNFSNILLEYKLKKYKIIGFGSTAKSNTLLNYCKFDNTIIDYIIDENILKHGLLTPGSNILITDIDVLKNLDENENYLIIILAWNFYNEILDKILEIININNFDILNINPLKIFKYTDKKLN